MKCIEIDNQHFFLPQYLGLGIKFFQHFRKFGGGIGNVETAKHENDYLIVYNNL